MKNAAKVSRNATWLTVQPIVLGVTSLAVTALVARSLGAASYGVLILLLSYAALFSPISNLGLRPNSVREIAADRERALGIVEDMLVLRFSLALIAAIIAATYLAMSDQHLPPALISILLIQLVLNALAGCFIDGLYGVESMKSVAVVMGTSGLILQMACLAAVLLRTGLEGVAWAYTLGSAASLTISWRFFSRGVGAFKLRRLQRDHFTHIKKSWIFLFLNLVGTIRQRIDIVLINSLLGPHAAGIYGSSLGLIQRIDLIQDGINTALFPRVASIHEKSPDELRKLVRGAFRVVLLISTPITVGLCGVADEIIQLIFGGNFRESSMVLVILGAGVPFMFIYGVLFNVLTAMRMPRVVLHVSVVVTVLSVGYLFAGIRLAGVNGAAAAYVLSYATSAIAGTVVYWRALGSPVALRDVFGITVANVTMWVGLSITAGLGLAPQILVSVLVFGSMAFMLRLISLDMLKTIFGKQRVGSQDGN